MASLKIVIIKKYFDEIAAGTKKIEYREVKPFWESRLYDATGKKKEYDYIEFINGYNADARRMVTQYGGFTKRSGRFHIKVGKIIK
jgi:hypothetical protein